MTEAQYEEIWDLARKEGIGSNDISAILDIVEKVLTKK